MYTSLLLIFSLCFILTSCQHEQTIRPKARPHSKKIPTKQERFNAKKTLPAPERRKVEKQELKQREQQMAQINKPIKELTYEELKITKEALLGEEDPLGALKYLERMLIVSTDLNDLKDLRLEVADLNFDLGDLEKAENLYNDYVSFYPGSDLVEYASYKAILCCFYQTLETDRDQSKTKQAITLSNSFLKQESYKTYSEDVQTIKQICTNKAFESELNIFNFYLDQNKLSSAQQRLAYIKENFPPVDINAQVQIISSEAELAQRQGNTELYNQKQQELLALNTQLDRNSINQMSQPSSLASKKKNYANRF